MTAQEKAKELVNSFYKEIKYFERAKQCALIAVDEILNFRTYLRAISLKDFQYWQEVKQEIEKL